MSQGVSSSMEDVVMTNGMQESSQTELERAKFVLDGGCNDNVEEVLSTMNEIVTACKQSRAVPCVVIQAAHYMVDFLIKIKTARRGLIIVSSLLDLTARPGVLSTLHSALAQLCIASKIYHPVMPYLDTDVNSLTATEESVLDVKHVLLYYYYGGVIYSSIRHFERAFHFFEICINVPYQTTSAIQVEAYQKYLLTSILTGHKAFRVPAYANLCGPYLTLVQAAGEKDCSKFAASLASLTPFLEKNNNLGIAKQALEHVYKGTILQLTKTFLSLSLTSLATHLKMSNVEAERRITELIIAGKLKAKVNKRDDVIYFTSSDTAFDNTDAITQLGGHLKCVMETFGNVRELNKTLSLDPKFIHKSGLHNGEEKSAKVKDSRPGSSSAKY